MLKMIFLCRRRPDISAERYAELVLHRHAPLALQHHPTLRRYVINIAEQTPEGAPEYDSLPGIGPLLYESIMRRDYPVMIGVLFGAAVMTSFANIITDMVYRILDPRIRGIS